MAGGRISLLLDSPLSRLLLAMKGLDKEVRQQINTASRRAALPIWTEELATAPDALTRLRQRLAGTGTVGFGARNAFLRAGTKGKLSTGVPVASVAKSIEFGRNPDAPIRTRSRTGRTYQRRTGPTFGRRSKGYVVWPAAGAAIPRVLSLWMQTAVRTVHEAIEEAR